MVAVKREEIGPGAPSRDIIRLSSEAQGLDVIGHALAPHKIRPAAPPTPVSAHVRPAAAAAHLAESDHLAEVDQVAARPTVTGAPAVGRAPAGRAGGQYFTRKVGLSSGRDRRRS